MTKTATQEATEWLNRNSVDDSVTRRLLIFAATLDSKYQLIERGEKKKVARPCRKCGEHVDYPFTTVDIPKELAGTYHDFCLPKEITDVEDEPAPHPEQPKEKECDTLMKEILHNDIIWCAVHPNNGSKNGVCVLCHERKMTLDEYHQQLKKCEHEWQQYREYGAVVELCLSCNMPRHIVEKPYEPVQLLWFPRDMEVGDCVLRVADKLNEVINALNKRQ